MGNIHHQGLVNATPEAVYTYVADVLRAPEYITVFNEVLSGPEPPGPPAVGQRYRVAATFLGNRVALGLRLTALDPGRRVQMAMDGQPSGTITLTMAPAQDGAATQVTATLDTPQFNSLMLNMVLGGMLEDALHRLNRALQAGQ